MPVDPFEMYPLEPQPEEHKKESLKFQPKDEFYFDHAAALKHSAEWSLNELPKQYKKNTEILDELGLLENSKGERAIKSVDGKTYSYPTVENIQKYFESMPNIEMKHAQGFNRLLIVPFGLPIEKIGEAVSKNLIHGIRSGRYLTANGESFRGDADEDMIMIARSILGERGWGDLKYYPDSFDQKKDSGKTKLEILGGGSSVQPFPGFHVLLLPETIEMPKEGEGKTVAGRKQFECGMSAEDVLESLKTDPAFKLECGLTIEDWLLFLAAETRSTGRLPGCANDTDFFDVSDLPPSAILLGNLIGKTDITVWAGWYPRHQTYGVGHLDADDGHDKLCAMTAVK